MWAYLLAGFVVFLLGSIATYSRGIRESAAFPALFVGCSIVAGLLWSYGVRLIGDDMRRIMLFSLLWDVLIVAAYYGVPAVLAGGKIGWQSIAAGLVVVAGIAWFKSSVG